VSVRTPTAPRSVFREISERLEAPLPQRTRFLRELSSDLEALTGRLVAEGHAPEEARRRAAAALVPDPITLADLGRVHASWYRRVTGRLSGRLLIRMERGTLVAAVLALIVTEARALLRLDLFADPSPFLIPVLAAGTLTVASAAAKAFELWVKRDHRRPRRGLGVILGLAGGTLALAFWGVLFDLFELATLLESSPELAGALVYPTVAREAALVSIAILFALTGALGWFFASRWIAFVEHHHERAIELDASLDPSDRNLTER
jgi:hypothetical protein